MADSAALTPEEQKILEDMKADEGGKPQEKQEEKPAAKAEEKPAEAKPEEKPKVEEKSAKMVPMAALDEARSQNKDLRAELKTLKDLVAEGDKKLATFIDKATKAAEAPVPKFEDDPAANLKHENDQLKKALDEVRAKVERHEKAAEQGGQVSAFKAAVDAKEDAFAKEHPDYWEAAKFLQALWKDEFSEAGFESAAIPKLLVGKAMGITHQAMQSGKDPAAAIYNIAKRAGYAVAKAEEKKEEKPSGKEKLETLAKGQELAKGNGGGAGPDDITIATLAQMSDEDLDKLVQDQEQWAKVIRRSPLH